MRIKVWNNIFAATLLACASLFGGESAEPASEQQKAFDALCQKLQKGVTAEEMARLMQMAFELGRPDAASAAFKTYVVSAGNPSAQLLKLSADAALLCGDFDTAISRYKALVKPGQAGEESLDAAGKLCMILVDFLGREDAGYQFLNSLDAGYRAAPLIRKYDSWHLDAAQRRRDYAATARKLAEIFGEKRPLEEEQLFWRYLDALLEELAVNGVQPAQQAASDSLARLVPLYRAKDVRKRRLEFMLSCIKTKGPDGACTAPKSEDQLRILRSAADAYLAAAQKAATLREIVTLWFDGRNRFEERFYRSNTKAVQEFFVAAFERLPDSEKEQIAGWVQHGRPMCQYLTTVEQRLALAAKHAELFKKPAVRALLQAFAPAPGPEVYRRQAALLKGLADPETAAVNAMAVEGDLLASVKHLLTQESWHLRLNEPWELCQRMWQAYAAYPREKDKGLPGDYQNRVYCEYAKELAKSPLAFDARAARECLLSAWRLGGAQAFDKTPVLDLVQKLKWVPYSDDERRQVFEQLFNECKAFREAVNRKDGGGVPAKDLASVRTQMAALETALKERLHGNAGAGAPPDLTCEKMLRALNATQQKNKEAFVAVAKELYASVKDWETKKTPWGRAVCVWVLQNSLRARAMELPCQALSENLSTLATPEDEARVCNLLQTILSVEPNWNGGSNIPDKHADCGKALAGVLETALIDQVQKNKFWPRLFDTMRVLRRGHNWSSNIGEKLLGELIERKTLVGGTYCYSNQTRLGTPAYLGLLRQEFQGLLKKYPTETAFDEMFAEEIQKAGCVDAMYWAWGGGDTKRLVANQVARMLGELKTLPLGYGDEPFAYDDNALWQMHNAALNADEPIRRQMFAQIEATYGQTRFDSSAMGWLDIGGDLKKPDERKAFFERCALLLDRICASSLRHSTPPLRALGWMPNDKPLTPPEIAVLQKIVPLARPSYWWGGWGWEALSVMQQSASEKDSFVWAPHLWQIARDTNNADMQRSLAAGTQALLEKKHFGLSLAYASAGLAVLGDRIDADVRTRLTTVRAQALSKLGGSAVRVARTDPNWPIFEAQAAFQAGNFESAWDLYTAHQTKLSAVLKELDVNFCLWLLKRNTEIRRFDAAEEMARTLIELAEKSAVYDTESRGRLLLTYADVAFARQEYPRARAQYETIAATKDFENTRVQKDAELRVAEVDRLSHQFDRAITRLERLAQSRDKATQAESFYQLALVRRDQKDLKEAMAALDKVFLRAPDHNPARILQGELFVAQRRLMEATEIPIGLPLSQAALVPGKPLKINLEDRNLAMVGKSVSVEVRAWTDSGDEVIFNLLPFGDAKTKFQGQLPTALGAPNKNDRVLQVLGNDSVHYDFSDAFKRDHHISDQTVATLKIVTDAELYASSGKILTKEEQEAAQLEQMIRERLAREGGERPKEGALALRREASQVKPGSNIFARVVDADQCAAAQNNSLPVRVEASSGDFIEAFMLKESDPFTGIFGGAIPTAPGTAAAYASDSDEGKAPENVISPGNCPPWVGLPDNKRPKSFTVDLMDNVALGKLNVLAKVDNRKLKAFTLQTSLNGLEFTTIGAYPKERKPWDGSPVAELVRHPGPRQSRRLDDLKRHLEFEYIKQGTPKAVCALKDLSFKIDGGLLGLADAARVQDWGLLHIYAAFYQPQRDVRTFTLNVRASNHVFPLLALDGVADADPCTITRSLTQGVHRVDIYLVVARQANFQMALQHDVGEPPRQENCPDDMFSPLKQPKIAEAIRAPAATIAADPAGSSFDVTFGPKTQARILRLLIDDYESDAPAINKLTLTTDKGQQMLPTKEDLQTLRKNQVLEIVPGDRITLTYRDPRVLSPEKRVLEANLSVTYNNAKLSAVFESYDERRNARYVPLRRFKAGDSVTVYISDPDCDVTDKQDTLNFSARSAGAAIEVQALETEPHSGVFVGRIFPVAAAPQRPTEIKVGPNDDIVIAYLDRENTEPGIPWERTYAIEQASVAAPQLLIYDVASSAMAADEKIAARPATAQQNESPAAREKLAPTRNLTVSRPAAPKETDVTSVPACGPLIVEVLAPALTRSAESTATIFVQTAAGRAKAGKKPDEPFDPKVPGTIKLTATPSNAPPVAPPPGYNRVVVRSLTKAPDPLEEGRYTFLVNLELGAVPEKSLVDAEPAAEGGAPAQKPALQIRGNDEIFVALQYNDDSGAAKWLARKIALFSDVFFDAMDRRYEERAEGVYIGDKVYLRAVDLAKDTSDNKDEIEVTVSSAAGKTQKIKLTETLEHSGVFKSVVGFVYADDKAALAEPNSFGVGYGELVTCAYAPAQGQPLLRNIQVHKGADGAVVPFTKRFADPAMAVKTQFTIAEAYFEQAKKHRALGEKAVAAEEIALGKKILEEAQRDYPDNEARAQVDYLLANLALEYASDAEDEEAKKKYYLEAVRRFSDFVSSYPDSAYAAKSQFKKALAYEKMGDMDQAFDEYVKLSYSYPENELVAETIARMGQYFWNKGKEFDTEASKAADPVQSQKAKLKSAEMYRTAGQVLGRLSQRFPDHVLAGKTRLLSGQAYLQANDLAKCIEVLQPLTIDPKAGKDICSESMYWCATAHCNANDLVSAYRMLKKLTWDYPESQWAKYARGKLAEESFVKIEAEGGGGRE